MMTFTNFEENMLIALYQEHVHFGRNEIVSFRETSDKYGLEFSLGWLTETQKNLRRQGRISGPSNVMNDDMAAGKIAATGMKYVENKYGSKNGVGTILHIKSQETESLPEGVTRASGDVYLADRAPPIGFGRDGDVLFQYGAQTPTLIDSSSWTGLPSGYQLEEAARSKLAADLEKMEGHLLSLGLNQQTYSQARAYVVAARVLAEAPDPPADVIWEIINRANQVAGIASLFVSILALFVK